MNSIRDGVMAALGMMALTGLFGLLMRLEDWAHAMAGRIP
jgi:hypothetical protein